MAASPPVVPGRIFISYRREETAYPAGWLFDRLADHFRGGQVFKDVDSIQLGDDFVEVITRAVGSCDVLLTLIGEQWVTIADEQGRRRLDSPDDFVRLEIEAALTRKVRVIPILVDGARMPKADELPPSLAALVRRQALELSPNRFDFDTSRLLRVLDTTLDEIRTEHFDAAVVGLPEAKPPDPRTTELQDAPEPRVDTRRSRTPSMPPEVAATPSRAGPPSSQRKPQDKQRRLSTRARVLAGVAVGIVLIPLLIVALALRPKPSTTIPDPGSASVTDAVALLRRAGLTVGVTPQAHKAIATGHIIRMVPSAGTRVQRGAQVMLFVSSGPMVSPLPAGTRELVVGFVHRFASSKDNPDGVLKGFDPILFADPKTGRLQGLNLDLANALGKKLKIKFVFKEIGHFTHSLSDVVDKRVDIGMSVLRDQAEGRKDVDFIDYLDPGTALLIPRGNPNAIRSLGDLCGRTVVRPLEMSAGSIIDQSHQCKTNNMRGITLMSCPKVSGFLPDLDEGVPIQDCPPGGDPLQLVIDRRVDAAVLDLPVAERLMETSSTSQQLTIATPAVKAGPYGIAILKGDSRIRDALRSALQAIIADGTYDRILAKWGLQDFALRTAAVNSGP
jgi:ABC-type amino acid transport substrate-binding protein